MKSDNSVKTRFAPSPTGMLHIGGLRTALFNWLLARSLGGKFVLRIEDTDKARTVEGAKQYIVDSLSWLGLDFDEKHTQSERQKDGVYDRWVKKLLSSKGAYFCNCTKERLSELRETQKAQKKPPGYDGHCRDLGLQSGFVVRVRVPDEGVVEADDQVFGKLTFKLGLIDDFIIVKADGMPTYHLAHLVDDYEMGITHVLRGEEWISSISKHVLLHDLLKIKPPIYAHVPLILGKDKSKLSKRHGDFGALTYEERGFESSAMLNFLSLLGWSPKDEREFLKRDEIVDSFSIKGIHKHPAVFDEDKLLWLNKTHLRDMPQKELSKTLFEGTKHKYPKLSSEYDAKFFENLIPLISERLSTRFDFATSFSFFIKDDEEIDIDVPLITKKSGKEDVSKGLFQASLVCQNTKPFLATSLEHNFRVKAEELGLKAGIFFFPVRVAITGSSVAPPLFDTIEKLGLERTLKRLKRASEMLS